MDIWQWVTETRASLRAAGNERLADLIDGVWKDVCDGAPKAGQATLPEALDGARARGYTWLEVYFRHWVLNGRLVRIKEGETAYPEAVELFRFAQRPENRDCPQSVCTANDLAACYGTVDSKGLAQERIALCEETLSRIDPSWACYNCLTGELVEALIDDGRAHQALELAERMVGNRRARRQPSANDYLILARARFAAGAYADALALLDFGNREVPRGNETHHFLRSCLLVRTLAELGQIELALKWRPSEFVADYYGGSLDLVAALFTICSVDPQKNTYFIGRHAAASLRHFHQVGAHRLALDTLPHVVTLAVARGSRWSANLALRLARPHLEMLRAPHGAPERFAQLEAVVAAMRPTRLPVPATQLMRHLGLPREYEPINYGSSDNPEQDLDYLLAAAAELPADPALANAIAAAMRACGAKQEALDYQWAFVRAHPEQDEGITCLLQDLLYHADYDGATHLAHFLAADNLAMSYWCHARTATCQRRWTEVGEYAALLVGLDQADVRARKMWADAALCTMQFETALRLSQELVGMEAEGDDRYWRVIVAASALQRWDIVESACASLETPFKARGAGEEPEMIEVAGWVNGTFEERTARRIGPATARITSIDTDIGRQCVRDLVVFDPNPEFQRNDEDYPCLSYDFVHLLEKGGYGNCVSVGGRVPGEQQFAVLTAALDALEWDWEVTGKFWCKARDSDEKALVMYLKLAAPASTTPAMIDAKLAELTAGLAHPMCWPELAEAAGVDSQWHWDVEERYGMY